MLYSTPEPDLEIVAFVVWSVKQRGFSFQIIDIDDSMNKFYTKW